LKYIYLTLSCFKDRALFIPTYKLFFLLFLSSKFQIISVVSMEIKICLGCKQNASKISNQDKKELIKLMCTMDDSLIAMNKIFILSISIL